jgi:hypothetical protein
MRQIVERLQRVRRIAETPEEKELRESIIQMCELYLASSEGVIDDTVALAERLSAQRVIAIDRREPSRLDLHLAYFRRSPIAYLAEQARDIRACVRCGMRGITLSGQWSKGGRVARLAISMWYHWLALAPAAVCPLAQRWEARHINQLLNLMEPLAA